MKLTSRILLTGTALISVLLLNACSTLMPSRSSNVNFNGTCEQREEDGYYDFIKLKVNHNVVSQLEWTANPRQGRCQFNLNEFTQVKTRPQVDLQSKVDRRCHIYIWENGRYISVSPVNCQTVCAQNDRILPVLLNERISSCAQNMLC